MSRPIDAELIEKKLQETKYTILGKHDAGYAEAFAVFEELLSEAPTLELPDVTLYIESANFQGLGTTLYAAENVAGYKKGEAVQIYGTKYENYRSYFLIWSKEYNGWSWRWATFFTPIPRGGEDV